MPRNSLASIKSRQAMLTSIEVAETLSQVEREVEDRSVKYTKQQAHYLAEKMAAEPARR